MTVLLNGKNTCVSKAVFAYVSNGSGRINLKVVVNMLHPIAFVCDQSMFPHKSLHFVAENEGRRGHFGDGFVVRCWYTVR